MIPDQDIKSIRSQIVFNTATSAEYCDNVPLVELIELYNDLRNEARRAKSNGKS